jgi:arylsulfatase A-like enzyme
LDPIGNRANALYILLLVNDTPIIKDPRMSVKFKGTVNDDFTLNIDLTATILAAAGIEPLPSMMGRDISILYRKGGLQAASMAQA